MLRILINPLANERVGCAARTSTRFETNRYFDFQIQLPENPLISNYTDSSPLHKSTYNDVWDIFESPFSGRKQP
jgi:hypothetical protein